MSNLFNVQHKEFYTLFHQLDGSPYPCVDCVDIAEPCGEEGGMCQTILRGAFEHSVNWQRDQYPCREAALGCWVHYCYFLANVVKTPFSSHVHSSHWGSLLPPKNGTPIGCNLRDDLREYFSVDSQGDQVHNWIVTSIPLGWTPAVMCDSPSLEADV
jgi:hypothetical protein